MMDPTTIRPYRTSDARTLAEIFFDAVRDGTAPHYDRRQREAWAPTLPEPSAWAARLAAQTVVVAEREAEGFALSFARGRADLFSGPFTVDRSVRDSRWDDEDMES